MEVNSILLDNEIQVSLEGRKNYSYHIIINSHCSGSLWKPKGTVHGPTGRALFRSSCESNSHKSGHGLFYHILRPQITRKTGYIHRVSHYHHPNPRLPTQNWLLKVNTSTFKCKWFWTGCVCVCFIFNGDFKISDYQRSRYLL